MASTVTKTDIAKGLLGIKAVFLRPDEPFTWASGIKSPIYCDNRLILSYPEVRETVETGLAELVAERFPQADAIMGTSTAGIAHAAIVGYKLGKPMGYVRGSAKDHGRKNQIEGHLEPGAKVVVIEDLISTGGSSIECAQVLRDSGAEVLAVVSIFTYGMAKATANFDEAGFAHTSLCDFDTLVEVAADEGYVKPGDVARLRAFRDNPSDESWIAAQ